MDLLVLNHRDPRHPQAGGAEVILFEVLKRFVNHGVQVTWMSERFPYSLKDEVMEGIIIKRRGGIASLHAYALFEARKHEAVFDSVAHSAPFLSFTVNKSSVAIVYHVHQDVLGFEVDPIKASFLRRMESLVKHYPNIVAISHKTKEELVSRFGVSRDSVRVIHSGIDHAFYKPGERSKEPMILWIGRLKRYKNPLDAVAIYSLLSQEVRKKAKLVVAGGGDLDGDVREAVEGVGGRFVGPVYGKEKLRLYQSAWVVLSTSFIEGWGMTVVEANACGTPVVGYATGSLPEIIRDGVNGFTVPYKDLRAAAKRVEQILTMDSWEREALWKESHEESLKYDWDKTAAEYYGVLKSLF